MKFKIIHESRSRLHIKTVYRRFSVGQADEIERQLLQMPFITHIRVYDRIGEISFQYQLGRSELIQKLIQWQLPSFDTMVRSDSTRELSNYYKSQIIVKTCQHFLEKILLPMPIKVVLGAWRVLPFVKRAIGSLLKGKLEVEVLDATAIVVSLAQKDIATAGSIMYLLGLGEILEEWSHKKSMTDLAHQMSLDVDKVWIYDANGQEVSIPIQDIQVGDQVIVRTGSMIPLDGEVIRGHGMVNQASMTGESAAVEKKIGAKVFAGTVLETGELIVQIDQIVGESRYDRILKMIEEGEKLKSNAASKAEHLADRLVPASFVGAFVTFLLTRNFNRALSFLMVDFSCALKLAMPLSILSAMKEAGKHQIVVKGGKFLEACAEADTIIFDKTGTLTEASPKVAEIYVLNGYERAEMLRLAACLEEHFPHSVATAVVEQARQEDLHHEEMHTEVEYIIAHGIVSKVDNQRILIGSAHFIFEDEGILITPQEEALIESLPQEMSHLYMAIDEHLAAIICIEDPIRKEAYDTIQGLKARGIRPVMMTGDSYRTAKSVAKALGIDEFYAGVLPEDKANYVLKEKEKGKVVLMIGDGINDSPALSASDAGIAMQDGSFLAREVSDITISSSGLKELLTLVDISHQLMKRVQFNYRFTVGFNAGLILAGVTGLLMPNQSAILHNVSTLYTSLKSMSPILKKE